jgi:hypothetical protein
VRNQKKKKLVRRRKNKNKKQMEINRPVGRIRQQRTGLSLPDRIQNFGGPILIMLCQKTIGLVNDLQREEKGNKLKGEEEKRARRKPNQKLKMLQCEGRSRLDVINQTTRSGHENINQARTSCFAVIGEAPIRKNQISRSE